MRMKALMKNALRPGYLPEMARKASLRVTGHDETAAGRKWAESVATSLDSWADGIASDLWAEARDFARAAEESARPQLAELAAAGVTLGGAGAYDLMYFLCRYKQPEHVLETGVAAGWSTHALLAAMDRNGRGDLWSSDFPYFRIENPEQYIGCLVPDHLRGPNWHLFTRGDRANLRHILEGGRSFGIVHYDSDKSRAGREHFLAAVRPHLVDGALVVMDDINDDLFFRDEIASRDPDAVVFEREGKYVGVSRFSS